MKNFWMAMILAVAGLCAGCGDDGDGGGDDDADGNSSSNSSETSGSSSSQQTCDSKHSCINGACQCDAGPQQGQSCCDPDDSSCTENKCDSFCEYCS